MPMIVSRRHWRRPRALPVGVTVVVIVLIVSGALFHPAVLADPLVLAAVKSAVTVTTGGLTMRALHIRTRRRPRTAGL
ncbi:hypothetical protein ADK60_37430 [Streptomyces sp. XY431]|uniref:hypothetical protein n=1 Tax=Streptomycetaceae TaxID=2062 RepID=UPI0006ADA52D|nr:hypothetical protein [Streptomyces sp. XY431]KOV10722.1 hypothetical protein ADK60_37430 [Streptomyces sp. XY431]